jgi:outer membrane immunogenic protein
MVILTAWSLAAHAEDDVGAKQATKTRFVGHRGIKPPPPPPPPPKLDDKVNAGGEAALLSWTGFYLGANAGANWLPFRGVAVDASNGQTFMLSTNSAAAMFGGFVGYNVQRGRFVFGLEGDVEGAALRASQTNTSLTSAGPVIWSATNDVRASLRARAGVAMGGGLFFVTAGPAMAEWKYAYAYPPMLSQDAGQFWRAGWTVGAGIEYPLATNWTGRLEYRFSDFGTATANSAIFPNVSYRERLNDDAFRIGVGYRFR